MSKAWDFAGQALEACHEAFVEHILPGLRNLRVEDPISDKQKTLIEQDRRYDVRPLRWASLSAKGDSHHLESLNISLADHVLSVARGGAFFAAIRQKSRMVDQEQQSLTQVAALAFVIGLLHDLDKAYGQPGKEIQVSHVEKAIVDLNIQKFLAVFSLSHTAQELLKGIELVEDRSAGRGAGVYPIEPDRRNQLIRAAACVKFADAMESRVSSGDPEGMADRLVDFLQDLAKADADTSSGLQGWEVFNLYDGHHAFIMEMFLDRIIKASIDLTGAPPLLSMYHDGRLLTILWSDQKQSILEQAIEGLLSKMPFTFSVLVNARGGMDFGGRPLQAWQEVVDFVYKKTATWTADPGLPRVLLLPKSVAKAHEVEILKLMQDAQVVAKWKPTEQQVFLLSEIEPGTEQEASLVVACALALGIEVDKKTGILPQNLRFKELSVHIKVPAWIESLEDSQSKKTLLALLAVAESYQDPAKQEALFGEEGFFVQLVQGTPTSPGVFSAIPETSTRLLAGLRQHLTALMNGTVLGKDTLDPDISCFISGLPAPRSSEVSLGSMVYAIKVSAFSYRTGRPENRFSSESGTFLSPISEAEYKLRSDRARKLNRREGSLPVKVFSPSYSGLFGGVVSGHEQELSIWDLARIPVNETQLNFPDPYERALHLSRFEEMPRKLGDRLSVIRLMLKAILRTGRPLHVFQGMPIPHRAIFYYDALDPEISMLLGTQELRLDQLPMALKRLQLAEGLVESNLVVVLKQLTGYGVAAGHLELGGLALAIEKLQEKSTLAAASAVAKDLFHKELQMSSSQTQPLHPLVKLSQMAPSIQRRPSYQASNSEKERLLRICLEALDEAASLKIALNDAQTLQAFVAGQLRQKLDRRPAYSAATSRAPQQTLAQAIDAFAETFVKEVVSGVFHHKNPSNETRSRAFALYVQVSQSAWAIAPQSSESSEDLS